MGEANYFGTDADARKEAEALTEKVLNSIDWARIKKRLDDATHEVLDTLHYHVEDCVANDASWNLEGRVSRRARDIVDALIRGDEKVASEVFGHDFQREARAKILEANSGIIVHGALSDAKKEIDRLKAVIANHEHSRERY